TIALSNILFTKPLCKIYEKIFLQVSQGHNNIDIVHVHIGYSVPLACRWIQKVPIVLDTHGIAMLRKPQSYSLRDMFAYLTLKVGERRLLQKCTNFCVIVVPSPYLKKYLFTTFKIPQEKIYVIPDGINLDEVPQYDGDIVNRLRDVLKLNNNITIAYAGNPSIYHGFIDLIKAFNIVRKIIDMAKLLLIIPKAYKDKILGRIINLNLKDHVTIIENVPRRKLYYYLYISNVLVLPHRTGTQFDFLYSNKLLDYIATGKPIVAYALRPVKDLLAKYPLKVLVKPNDPVALANGITKALDECNQRVYGKHYIENYDWKNISKIIVELYSNLSF
ncbi:MAG: glycosyltransferase, partial [Candidatus Methanomethylicia archaeon]